MDFNQIFLNLLLSTFSGIAGGLIVYWTYNGIHVFNKGFKFDKTKFIERYIGKFTLMFCILLIMAFLFSMVFWIFQKGVTFFHPILFILISVIICELIIIITAILKYR